MITERARHVSAFVCALGHFEWFRMPFELKNAPMIYHQLVDNAVWGYVQPKDGWQDYATKVKVAEDETASKRATETKDLNEFGSVGSALTNLEADHRALDESDPLQRLVNDPASNMFVTGAFDEPTIVPVFRCRVFVDDIFFGGKSCEVY